MFLYFISTYSQIRMFSKMQRTWTVCIPSGRCFIEQKGMNWSRHFLSWISVGKLECDGMGGRDGSGGGFDSYQLNCAFPFSLFSFFIFFFSYFLTIICSHFHLSSFILSYSYITYFHIRIFTYSHVFKQCSAHEQYAFRQEDVS
jgi:hypothetical protein